MLSRLKIATRINALLALAALGMLFCAFIGLCTLRVQMLEDKRAQLSSLMDLAIDNARKAMDGAGALKTETGRSAFLDAIGSAKFGASAADYFFVFDSGGVFVLHPDHALRGRSLSDAVQPATAETISKFIDASQRPSPGGFVEYNGPDGNGKLTPKMAHLRDVPELNLVVGLGFDLKHINAAFSGRLRMMAGLFAFTMLSIGLAGGAVSLSIGKRLSNAVNKIKRLANGDLDIAPADASEKSELGEVDKALDVLRANATQQHALQDKVREQHELLLRRQKESEERWRRFVDQAPVAMLMLDCDMVHLACSSRWVELSGIEDGSIGRFHYDVYPEAPEHWRDAHRRALAGESVSAEEEIFVRADGEKLWVRWEVRPWLKSDETVGGIAIWFDDVTDRVLAVHALRESELRMRLGQEAAKAGVWESRASEKNYVWSENLWKLFGLEPHRCESTSDVWFSTVHPDDRERVRAAAKRAAFAHETFEVQWRVNLPEGEPERWLFGRGSPLNEATTDHYFGVVIDITEQKLVEKALRESELRMRLAQEGAKIGAFEWRLADNSLHWSDSMWDVYDLQKPEGFKTSIEVWLTFVHPADRGRVLAKVLEAASLGKNYEIEWRLNGTDGDHERWFLNRGTPLLNSKGSPDRYFGVVIEITDQKRAENALRNSGLRMRLAQEAARSGAWEWRLADNQVRWTESRWSLDGLLKTEQWGPISETCETLIHPSDYERAIATASRSVKRGEEIEVEWRLKPPEGEPVRWFMARGRPIAGADGRPDRYFGVVIEITEGKLADSALREAKRGCVWPRKRPGAAHGNGGLRTTLCSGPTRCGTCMACKNLKDRPPWRRGRPFIPRIATPPSRR